MPTEAKKSTAYLTFGVYPHGDNLFSAMMTKINDRKVVEWKHGTGTTLGHAIAIAENLMGAYALYCHEQSAEDFYDEAIIV